MALNTKPPGKKPAAVSDEAFDRVVAKGKDQRSKPGPKAGGAYGLGISAGANRRQITTTFPTELLERLNSAAERTHQQRSALIVLAVHRLLESDEWSLKG